MRFRFLLLAILCLANQTYSFAQNFLYDEVKIYAIPFHHDYAIDDIDKDYVRAHHMFAFSSTDKEYIEELFEKVFSQNYPNEKLDSEYFISEIRVVIDFINKSKIGASCIINKGQMVYSQELATNVEFSFQAINEKKCFIKEVIPFADKISYGLSDCK